MYIAVIESSLKGNMKIKIEKLLANNPNPVLSAYKDGTVLYSNEAGEFLLKEWQESRRKTAFFYPGLSAKNNLSE